MSGLIYRVTTTLFAAILLAVGVALVLARPVSEGSEIADPLCVIPCWSELDIQSLTEDYLKNYLDSVGHPYDLIQAGDFNYIVVMDPRTNERASGVSVNAFSGQIHLVDFDIQLSLCDMVSLYGLPDALGIDSAGVIQYEYHDEKILFSDRSGPEPGIVDDVRLTPSEATLEKMIYPPDMASRLYQFPLQRCVP